MALYTYVNLDADGNLSNPDNWYIGGFPAGGVPGSSDTAALDGLTVTTGTLAAAVTSATGTTINGGTFSNDFSAAGVTYNGGTFSGSVAFGAGSTLTADPGVAFTAAGTSFTGGTFTSLFTDQGGCSYYSGTVFNVGFVLGQGSVIYDGVFNDSISTVTTGTSPTVSGGAFTTGCTFTATSVSGGTFPDGTVFHACTISGGSFGTTVTGCTVTGISSISGGAWSQLTVNGDVAFSGSPTFSLSLTIHYIRGPYTYSAYIANATISVPDPGYPPQNKVLSATSFGDIGDGSGPLYTGTLVLPSPSNVLSGVTYGIGGSGSTGTYVGGTIPSSSDVRNGISVGSGTGTLVVPSASNVLAGITFDNGTTGTLVLPATANVLTGTTYGVGGTGSTGTLDMAATRIGSALIRRR